MKLIKHERSGKPEHMTLEAEPMTVWLGRDAELKIEKGDALTDVANVVTNYWGLSQLEARKLVAYWFAIGKRLYTKQLAKPWKPGELDASLKRRYLA